MDMKTLRANGNKAFRMTERGDIFIGDDEFSYPVSDGSIKVERMGKGRHHLVTLTLIVGSVDLEQRPRKECPNCGISIFGSSTIDKCTSCEANLERDD